MGPLYNQVITLLTNPPGNLVYHLVLLFSIAGALPGALNLWPRGGVLEGRRMLAGLGLLLLAQLALIVFAAAASYYPAYSAWLPALDRAVSALGLVVLIWLWAFPGPSRSADVASGLLGLLAVVLAFFTAIWWSANPAAPRFNGSLPDLAWSGLKLALAVVGGLLILRRRPAGFESGLAVFLLLMLGDLAHLLLPSPQSDYPGAVRLAQIAAYPLLLTLPFRFAAEASEAGSQQYLKRRAAIPPELFQLFLSLARRTSPHELCRGITETVSRAMSADLCLLLSPPDANRVISIQCGYNLSAAEHMPSATFDGQLVPVIAEAIRQGRPLHLPAGGNIPDLVGLENILSLPLSGSLLLSPLTSRGGDVLMALVLLTPYSGRRWTARDENYLADIAGPLAEILERARSSESDEEKIAQANRAVEDLQRENQRLSRALEDLAGSQGNLPDEIERLQGELQAALAEIALLRQGPGSPGLRGPSGEAYERAAQEKLEAVASLAQDVRQPVLSILSYAELLLGETLGELSASQRKIVERLKTNAERVDRLSEVLIKATLGSASRGLPAEAISIEDLIAALIEEAAPQLQEKSIQLSRDLPGQLPPVSGDRETLNQVLRVLLANALAVTPPSGEIAIHARLAREDGDRQYVLVQVSDLGGGIAAQDQERIFSSLAGGQKTAIPGLGSDPAEVSKARSLVEAVQGRLWLESNPGRGCTFSLLLPVQTRQAPVGGQEEAL